MSHSLPLCCRAASTAYTFNIKTVFPVHRTNYETDLLTFWANNGNQSFPGERLFICEASCLVVMLSKSKLSNIPRFRVS